MFYKIYYYELNGKTILTPCVKMVEGNDIFSIYEEARGISDDAIIQKAYDENRIRITTPIL